MTLSPDQIAGWVLSYPVCHALSLAMESMFHDENSSSEPGARSEKHKEEGKSRRKLDFDDRQLIREELKKFTHPLKYEDDKLVNIYNGCVASEKVNVHNAVAIGESKAAKFKDQLPIGFHNTIHSEVVTMQIMKRGVKVGGKTVYDLEKLYGRLLILTQKRKMSLKDVFSYELAPLPAALYDEYGALRKSKKHTLIDNLAKWTTHTEEIDVELIDGNEKLYGTTWPKAATVKSFAESFINSVQKNHEVFVIFDKYFEGSIKSHERSRRAADAHCPSHHLTMDTVLPPREVVMKNTENKKQLLKLLCEANTADHIHMTCEGLCLFGHEEADVCIVTYLQRIIQEGNTKIVVAADDTDIFALLVHFCWKWQLLDTISITMKKMNGKLININEVCRKLGPKCIEVLGLHALTGCDTTSYPYGKGKVSALNILKNHDSIGLQIIGDPLACQEEVLAVGRQFFCYLYGSPTNTCMNELCYKVFSSKKDTPKIKSLTPTDGSLDQHILRSHLQAMLWKAADQKDPPAVDIWLENEGWVSTT